MVIIKKFTMLNIDEFLNRLEELMKNHQLNAAAFAEKIGVQRSSVSHILSRRNKPSLEFIFKIQSQFEEVDFDWLLLGVQNNNTPIDLDLHNFDSIKSNIDLKLKSYNNDTEVTQIIQTYKDGSFRLYLPKS
tara:strand:+ start:1100 stop:1495 length:396 start_codon:yes stop_codon:yes gene_type:complete